MLTMQMQVLSRINSGGRPDMAVTMEMLKPGAKYEKEIFAVDQ